MSAAGARVRDNAGMHFIRDAHAHDEREHGTLRQLLCN